MFKLLFTILLAIPWTIADVAIYGASTQKVSQNSWVLTYPGTGTAGTTLVLVTLSFDNISTVDGDNNEVTSISDPQGNTYSKAAEYTNAQGAAAAGTTVSVWYCVLTGGVTSSNTMTAFFSAATTAKVYHIRYFTVTSGNKIAMEKSAGRADDGADCGALTLSSLTARSQYLFVRAVALEASTTTGSTTDAGYTYTSLTAGLAATSGAGAASNITEFSEYRVAGSGVSSESTDPASGLSVDNASVMVALYEYTPTALPHRVTNIN